VHTAFRHFDRARSKGTRSAAMVTWRLGTGRAPRLHIQPRVAPLRGAGRRHGGAAGWALTSHRASFVDRALARGPQAHLLTQASPAATLTGGYSMQDRVSVVYRTPCYEGGCMAHAYLSACGMRHAAACCDECRTVGSRAGCRVELGAALVTRVTKSNRRACSCYRWGRQRHRLRGSKMPALATSAVNNR
jgi:hypothetical protein